MSDNARRPVPRPTIAVGCIPLRASRGAIQPIVLSSRNPTLHEKPVEDGNQFVGRSRRPAPNRRECCVGSWVGLAWVNDLNHDALHRDDVLDDALALVNQHRVVGRERDDMATIERL